MIKRTEREPIVRWIDDAVAAGARRRAACSLLGVSTRTLERWRGAGTLREDGRCTRVQVARNQLSDAERAQVLMVANSEVFADLPPSQIVPILAERGEYIASESTFYRLLRAAGQLGHRQSSRPAQTRHKPRALSAWAPNQLYSWDISYLPTTIRGVFFYLYLFMDVYSRKIVGWQVYAEESSAWAADLMTDIAASEHIAPDQVILHADNGGPMKGATMRATLQRLGIVASFSRPAVSNDNPYSEALFKTLKYRPLDPLRRFDDIRQARQWVAGLVNWYNHDHRHSAIQFVTPAQRHAQQDHAILAQRQTVYALAKTRHPERWSGPTRDWTPADIVFLNPETTPGTNEPDHPERINSEKDRKRQVA
jgi:transposase InsO family protein